MPWFRVDDKLHDHAKAALAGAQAMGLWVLAGSWCAEHLDTEGFVPQRVLNRFATRSRQVADKLVTANLWERDTVATEKGFRFLHWAEFQLTPEDQAKDRAAARDRMRKVRADRKASSPEVRPNDPRTFADVLDPTPKPKPLPVVPTELRKTKSQLPCPTAPNEPEVDPWIFTEFWKLYPRKVRKEAARKAWRGACRRSRDPDEIVAGAGRFALDPNLSDEQFIPHPATWLNQGGWEDGPLPSRGRSERPTSTTDDRVAENLARAARYEQQHTLEIERTGA